MHIFFIFGDIIGSEFLALFRPKICGSFFLCSLTLKSSYKSHKMTPFLFKKEVLGEKIIIWVKYSNVFTQRMIFYLNKLTWERENKMKKEPQIPCPSTVNSWFNKIYCILLLRLVSIWSKYYHTYICKMKSNFWTTYLPPLGYIDIEWPPCPNGSFFEGFIHVGRYFTSPIADLLWV